MFPTLIHTCATCCKEIAKSRGWNMTNPARNICFECFTELDEKAWKYDQLNK
jgi:hypothetical protein